MFRAPKKTLGDLNAEAAAKLIAAAADIALVVDSKGVIRDVAIGGDSLAVEGWDKWIGLRWIDTVTVESRVKIEDMLREAVGAKQYPRSRQVNHASKQGNDVPIRYSAIEVGENGRIVAVGRDMRAVAALQQRLVETQQTMEREYSRLRQAETRYRLLFQIADEAVLVIDAASMKIIESNPAAIRLLSAAAKRLGGRSFPDLFDANGAKSIHAHLSAVLSSGRSADVIVKLSEGAQEFVVTASMFRQENVSYFLVRLWPVGAGRNVAVAERSRIFDFVNMLPDGFVVTDFDCKILKVNSTFLEICQIASEAQTIGQSLDRWLGRHDVDVKVLAHNLKERGAIRNFSTVIRGDFGAYEDVEVSAVSVADGEAPSLGFTIRLADRRTAPIISGNRNLPRSVEQMTELVGRVSMKELVRDTTDIIEKLCIEAALELTGDNRASAAEMLGLSRQSLYSKLRRLGLGDLDGDDDEDDDA